MREQRPALFADIARVAEMDSRANQVQIWGPTPLLSVLAQIQRLHKRQVLDKPCVECLLDEATDLVLAIREAARTGHKSAGGSFELYAHPHRDQQPDLVVEVGDYRLTVHTLATALFRRLAPPKYGVPLPPALRQPDVRRHVPSAARRRTTSASTPTTC